MADALCGPSNPLQSFQKHTSADRTLQQDRSTSRAGPSQGFRSDPGPSAGLLDPEFEAFQTAHAPGLAEPQLHPHAHRNFLNSPSPVSASQHPAAYAGWASDFQRLHISQPPSSQSQLHPQSSAPAWHRDFQRQQQQSPSGSKQIQQPLHQTSQFQPYQPSYNYNFSPMTQYPLGQTNNLMPQAFQEQDQYDAAAFEQEFEAHAAALLQENPETQAFQQSTELGQDILLAGPDVLQGHDDSQDSVSAATSHYRQRSEALEASLRDQLNELQQKVDTSPSGELAQSSDIDERVRRLEETAERANSAAAEAREYGSDRAATDEDLARTAGELLQRVADDTSTKFRESNFLSLMMQLRDREVRVEGNEIVSNDNRAEAISESTMKPDTARQRPSSVPPRRNRIGLDDTSGFRDFRMAGALHDGDVNLDNSGIGSGARLYPIAFRGNAAGCFFGKDMDKHDFP